MSKLTLVLALLCMAVLDLQAQPETCSIRGQVVDDSGTPVPGAVVLYNNVPPLERKGHQIIAVGPRVNWGVRSGSDGSFLITGIPAGLYYLCASGTKPNHLRSCEWTQTTTSAVLGPAEAVSRVVLRIIEGTLLRVRVLDVRNLLRDPVDDTRPGLLPVGGGNFRLSVARGTMFSLATLARKQGGEREYVVAVPKSSEVELVIDTSHRVVDSRGLTVSTGRPGLPVRVQAAAEQIVEIAVP